MYKTCGDELSGYSWQKRVLPIWLVRLATCPRRKSAHHEGSQSPNRHRPTSDVRPKLNERQESQGVSSQGHAAIRQCSGCESG